MGRTLTILEVNFPRSIIEYREDIAKKYKNFIDIISNPL